MAKSSSQETFILYLNPVSSRHTLTPLFLDRKLLSRLTQVAILSKSFGRKAIRIEKHAKNSQLLKRQTLFDTLTVLASQLTNSLSYGIKCRSWKRPLKMLCPCGYQRILPDSLTGKKVVCPKCKQVLRVIRDDRLAELFIKCPYCKEMQGYSGALSKCYKCKRNLVLPQSVQLQQDAYRQPLPVDSKATETAVEHSSSTIPEFEIHAQSLNKAKTGTARFGSAILISIASALIAFLAYAKINQPEQQQRPTRTPSFKQKSATAVPSRGNIATKIPRLISPSIDIEAATVEYGQALDPESSKVIGERLFLVITFKNLSECKISMVDLSIRFNNEAPSEHVHSFSSASPLEALSTRRIELDFAPNERVEAVTVTCNKVTSGSQIDSTRIVRTFITSE